jgi:hypothetical protein
MKRKYNSVCSQQRELAKPCFGNCTFRGKIQNVWGPGAVWKLITNIEVLQLSEIEIPQPNQFSEGNKKL